MSTPTPKSMPNHKPRRELIEEREARPGDRTLPGRMKVWPFKTAELRALQQKLWEATQNA